MLDVAAGSNPMHCRPARPMRRGRPRRREAAGDLPGSSVAQPRGEVHLVAGKPLLAGDEPDAPTLALSWRSARFASPGPSSVAPPERSSSQAWWLSFRSTTSPARRTTTWVGAGLAETLPTALQHGTASRLSCARGWEAGRGRGPHVGKEGRGPLVSQPR